MDNQADQSQSEQAKVKSSPLFDVGQSQGDQDNIRQHRDDLRFVIGLATGALVFSVTFVEKIAPVPKYKWLLVLGWAALLVSILAGIEACRRIAVLTSIRSFFGQAGGIWASFAKGPFDKQIMVELLARLGVKETQDKTVTLDQVRERYMKDLNAEDVERILKLLAASGQDDRPGPQGLLEELVDLLSGTGKVLDRLRKRIGPKAVLKSFRTSVFVQLYFVPVSLYSFYIGTFLVALFGILNFLF